jgi:hypothetical protein
MSSRSCRPSLTLETLQCENPTKDTSLFCPVCGERAPTEKDGPGVYRVSCRGCHRAAIVQLGQKPEAA